MAIVVKERNEIDELLKIYFGCMAGSYFIETLKAFIKYDGYGREYVCCSFHTTYEPWEEGYFGDSGVKISIDYPAYDKDVIAVISYEEFFRFLVSESHKFISEFSEKRNDVSRYLAEIKKRFNL